MARHALKPNPSNATKAELELAAKVAPSKRSAFRIKAIQALILGGTHEFVAELFSVSRQTLLIWIKAFNAQGIDGLIEKENTGRPRAIPEDKTETLRSLLIKPDQAEVTHWTAKKFHGHLRDQLQIEVGYRTVVRWLHEHDFRLKVPQPWPDRQDEKARQRWLKDLRELLADEDVELWYQDEMGVEGDSRPRRRWAEKGAKPRVTKNGDHVRMNVGGMICPRTGEAFLLEMSHSDREMFQVLLDMANEHIVLQRPRNILICDNASWHKSKSLDWGRFEPLFLPAYSPDFNPIERLWLLIKSQWFADFHAKDLDALIQRLDRALVWAMDRQSGNQITCAIH